MPAIQFEGLDVAQGFNFNRDVQKHFGFCLSVVIGDGSQIKVDSDLNVIEPVGEKKVKAAGVLQSVTWDGGFGDPIKLKFNVSTQNKQKIAKLLHEKLNNTNLTVDFAVYDYDPVEKAWFVAFAPSSPPLKGLIWKDSGKLDMSVEVKEAASEVANPQNWPFTISIMPGQFPPPEVTVTYRTGALMPVCKQWGVPVDIGSK